MSTQIALIIVGCVISALLSFAVLYLREIKTNFERGQDQQNRDIDKIEQRLNGMPETYVFREDFVRWSISIDKKIDDLGECFGRKLDDLRQEIRDMVKQRSQ